MTWLLEDVVRASGAEVVRRGSAREFESVATDTRTLRGGELFVALRGVRYDAHRFVSEAVAAGARGLLVEHGIDIGGAADVTVLTVRDTLRAFQDLAAALRARHAPSVIAITGSNGKTTTKEMIAAILGEAGGAAGVLKTTLNLNNLIGVPLTLLRLTGRERHAVIEMGMNAPGEIRRLTEIADPDVGVITNVGPAHLEGLGSLDAVASAKGELFEAMRPNAVAVANADDARVAALADRFPGRVVRFGGGTAIAAEEVRLRNQGAAAFRLRIDGRAVEVALRIPGRHNVANALAAAAAAHVVGISLDAIRTGLERAEAVGDRMRLIQLATGVTILNDSYNANPASVAAALQSLAEAPATRRIAVLGDMLELGATSAQHHAGVGRLAGELGIDALYVCGDFADATRSGAVAAMAPDCVHVAPTHAAIAEDLARITRAGDWILVKGSRGAHMEEVVRLLGGTD